MTDAATATQTLPKPPDAWIYRHRAVVRVSHWINVICVAVLLMSGAQIFNAHPRLYWGQYGADADPAIIELRAIDGRAEGWKGIARVGPVTIPTTGVLGLSRMDGKWAIRGFPSWLTLPSYQDLATGRRWHFFFAWLFVINGLAYVTHSTVSGHFRKDILPKRRELALRHLASDICDHMRFKRPTGEAAKHYNTLQKLAYVVVILLLLLMLLSGLTMSPAMDAAFPALLDIFGGRQSARTVHFISASLIVAFTLVHVFEVCVAGAWNEIRSMVTGWYAVPPGRIDDQS